MNNTRIVTTLFISIFSAMLGVGIILPFLPLYAESMGASGIWLGIIFAGFHVSRTILMPFIGRLSDKKGRKAFIAWGLLIYTITSLGYVWASTLQELTVVRITQGCAGAMIFPIVMAYLGELSPKDKVGTTMGMFNMSLFAGVGFGPLMGGIIADYFTMDASFYAMAGFSLVALMLVLLFVPELHLYKEKKIEVSLIKSMESNRVRGLVSFRFSNSFSRAVFLCFVPVLAGFRLGLSLSQIGVLVASQPIVASMLQLPFGRLADKFSQKKLVTIGNLIDPLCLALIPFVHNFNQLLILCVSSGFGRAICIPAASALVVAEGRKLGMGSSMGIFGMAMSMGVTVGPLLGGLLMDYIGLDSVFFTTGLAGILGTSLFIWFMKHSS